jgi:hypothetical protein
VIGGQEVKSNSEMTTLYFVFLLILLLLVTRKYPLKIRIPIILQGLLYAFAVFLVKKLAFWLNGHR